MGKKQALAGMICGIVSVAFSFMSSIFPVLALFALPLGIVGLILSIKGGKQMQAEGMPKGIATAGLVLGIVGTALGAITFFTCGLCVICAAGAEKAANDALRDFM